MQFQARRSRDNNVVYAEISEMSFVRIFFLVSFAPSVQIVLSNVVNFRLPDLVFRAKII